MAGFDKKCFEYEVYKEADNKILKIYGESCSFPISLEESETCFSKIFNLLSEINGITTLILSQQREYEYDYHQVSMLIELVSFFKSISQDERFSPAQLLDNPFAERYLRGDFAFFQRLIQHRLSSDPLASYLELKHLLRHEKIKVKGIPEVRGIEVAEKFTALLEEVVARLEATKFIGLSQHYLSLYQPGSREIYRRVFRPTTRPDFMFTKLMAEYPSKGEILDSYSVGKKEEQSDVTIFNFPDSVKNLYHLTPPEFKFTEEKYELLDSAKRIMSEHQPTREEFTDPDKMREVFFNIGRDLITDLVRYRKLKMPPEEIDALAQALLRYTVGFGLIEILLSDEKIQDVNINSPSGEVPIFIVHQDCGDCYTNIYPTPAEVEGWATKLRLISGRPLDEANSILDTELKVPGFSSRVAAITRPLNPSGLAFSFRRHRDYPWTFPLYLNPKVKMFNPTAAGLLSFLIDNNAAILIAGTRSSGKTSLLGSFLVEIMRRYRMITLEDSVTGDSEISIRKNGIWQRTTIGKLIDSQLETYGGFLSLAGHEITGNLENIQLIAMDKQGKLKVASPSSLIRHKVSKKVYQIKTRTGRKIKVTEDHSLFVVGKQARITESKTSQLKIGEKIAVPSFLPLLNPYRNHLDLWEKIASRDDAFLSGEKLSSIIEDYFPTIKQLGLSRSYAKGTIGGWKRRQVLPAKIAKDLLSLYPALNFSSCFFKLGENSSVPLPIKLPLDHQFLTLLGLWIADGCYDRCSTIISSNDIEDREIVSNVARQFGLKCRFHSDNVSYILNSKTLKVTLQEFLGFTGNAFTKRIPDWIFSLAPRQIASVLEGVFSGDGCASDKEIIINLSSEPLLKDLQTLLLLFKIILRVGSYKKRDKTFHAAISSLEYLQNFARHIGFLQKYKNQRLSLLCQKFSSHDTTDNFAFDLETKEALAHLYGKEFNTNDYILRGNCVGRKKLMSLLKQKAETIHGETITLLEDNLLNLANADVLWDEILEIEEIKDFEDYVYDFSVPECESFVCENIVAHNTLELPTESLRRLGFNIQSLKVASALAAQGSEVDAATGIRSTLRLGDSAIIVGEVRSKEAISLYEAMRIGAAANVVAGTIHAASPYGVFDRVVNDIGVPRTSFKATDIIVVANPVKSASGIKRVKRVLSITEIRKEWEEDPLKEGAFGELMKYDPIKDELMVTDDLINGNSDILKSMAANIRDFAGNWDAVWENILLRGQCKQAIVDAYLKAGNKDILEAPFVIRCNDMFHLLSEKVKEEVGSMEPKRILFEYQDWLKKEIKKGSINPV